MRAVPKSNSNDRIRSRNAYKLQNVNDLHDH